MEKPNDDAQRKSISKPYCFRNEYSHTYCLVQLPFDRSSAAITLSPSITIAVSLTSSFSVSFGALKSIDGLHSSIQHSLASFTAPNCSVIDLNSCLSDIQMAMFMDTTNVPHKKHPKDTLHLTHSIFFGVGVFVCSHPTQNKHMFGYSRAVNVLFVLSILYIFILPICT